MAAGFAVASEGDNNNTAKYNGRMTLLVILSCTIAATGGLVFGYDIGISGTYMLLVFYITSVFVKLHKTLDQIE